MREERSTPPSSARVEPMLRPAAGIPWGLGKVYPHGVGAPRVAVQPFRVPQPVAVPGASCRYESAVGEPDAHAIRTGMRPGVPATCSSGDIIPNS